MQLSYHTNSLCSQAGTAVVGSFAANPWGLFDMHGNVWEWCLDAWDGSANYPAAAAVDPLVSGSPTSSRAYRGGGWLYHSHTCRSAFRGWSFPDGRSSSHGFRVVLGPVLAP